MVLSALIDFPDDASAAVYDKQSLFRMLEKLHYMGCRRLYWYHYGDESYEFFWKSRLSYKSYKNCIATIKNIPELNKTFTEYAKSFGMQTVAVIKPYENGISMVLPEGSEESLSAGILPHLDGKLPCMMDLVRKHPELRIKRRSWDLPEYLENSIIERIKIYKSDDKPTRIKKDNIRIFGSNLNCDYRMIDVDLDFSESIQTAKEDIVTMENNDDIITKKGDKVRVIDLSGFKLDMKYLAVTTDFVSGEPDFMNAGTEMIEVFDGSGNKLPISVGLSYNVWYGSDLKGGPLDFGVAYDMGWGGKRVYLDGKSGFVAFMKGKNGYLPTALCESEPVVHEYWLDMVRDCLEDGFDEIDFRIENHSTHTDEPFSFGYNDVILEEYEKRYGPAMEQDMDTDKIAKIRGENYTDFLKQANKLIKAAGKKMNVNLNVEFFRSDVPLNRYLAYPFNIQFQWKEWIRELDLDAVTLRTYSFKPDFVLDDLAAKEMTDVCSKKNLPVHYNRYIFNNKDFNIRDYAADMRKIVTTGAFESFIIYEVSSFIKSDEKGSVLEKIPGFVDLIRKTAIELDLF